jgi:NADH-quinone oxidoreductase subunit J
MTYNFENILLIIFAAGAVFTAIMMVTRKSPVTSALFLVANFFCVSVVYLFLRAQFIAIIQILVYAGAIMVLFLFVIMLLNLQDENKLTETLGYKKLTGIILAVFLFNLISITVFFNFRNKLSTYHPSAEQQGTIEEVGRQLYTSFSFPFELVSFVLLAAIVGAIVLAKKKFE